MIGYALASFYHVIGALAALVCLSFMTDILKRMAAHGDAVRGFPRRYIAGWVLWLKALPDDFRTVVGILPPKSEKEHHYGVGFPMEIGIAHTAAAWTGMAFYWSERNIVWMGQFGAGDYASIIPPFVFCVFYARGYLMHLKTIWRDNPWRWRLFLLAAVIYMPVSVLARS